MTLGCAPQPTVLVVDDYQDSREMYAAYLSLAGFRSVMAADGQEALQVAAALMPDLVLMDLSLPGIDGFEVTRRLKADPRTRHIPVVALTARSGLPAPEVMSARGFESLILKPCLPDVLAERVGELIGMPEPGAVRQTAPG
jgi:CheY-like chemotaxis protein